MKLLTLGPGQIGKSTFIYRLLGLMKGNIENTPKEDQPSRSTGQSDLRDACIKFNNIVASAKPDLSWELCELQSLIEGLMRLLSNQTQNECSPRLKSSGSSFDSNQLSLVPKEVPPKDNARPKSKSKKTPSKQITNAIDSVVKTAEGAEPSTGQRVVSPTLPIAPDSITDLINKTIVDYENLCAKCKYSPNVTKLHMLFNIADVGGQPAFLDMLPSLTIGPAMYFLFTKLINDSGDVMSIDDLTKVQPVQYRTKDDNEPLDCENYTYTLQEVLFCALSSIACFGLSDKEVEKYVSKESEAQKTSSLAVLFGTFADKINEDGSKKLFETESALKSLLSQTEFCKNDLISFPNPTYPDHCGSQVFFRVDNKSGSEQEIPRYRKIIQELVEQKFRKYNIPASWLGLSICLKILANKRETYKVSFDDCVELGKHFNMSRQDVKIALTFLHKYIGLVMYFSNDEHLQNLVICNPQVVFSSISELTFGVYNSSSRQEKPIAISSKQKKFEETGIFSSDDVTYPNDSTKLMSLQDLVHLLVHLNIAAEIIASSDEVSPKPKIQEAVQASSLPVEHVEYFFPAILKTTVIDTPSEEVNEEILPEPLCIRFEIGYLPVGFTCALSARLIAERKFKLPPEEQVLYKNKLKFRYAGQFNVTMISEPLQCKFIVTRHYGSAAFHACCPEIIKTIRKAADNVLKAMQKTLLSRNNYDMAFKCPLPRHQKDTTFGHEPLAKFVYTNISQSHLQHIECLECATTVSDLKPEMKVWFGEVRIIDFCSYSDSFCMHDFYKSILFSESCHSTQYHKTTGSKREQDFNKGRRYPAHEVPVAQRW